MRVSLNEIEKVCEKAACGVGVPAGADSDIGMATAWPEARSLPGVAVAARDLAEFDNTGLTWRNSDAERYGDAQGSSLLPHAGGLIDLAAADALGERGTLKTVTVANARSPLFLLPAAIQRLEDGCTFRLTWDPPEVVAMVGGDSGVTIHGDALLSNAATTLRIEAVVSDVDSKGPPSPPLLCDHEALQSRLAASLREGVAVDQASWDRLQEMAARTLVPASAESRRRGAGAEIDDNE